MIVYNKIGLSKFPCINICMQAQSIYSNKKNKKDFNYIPSHTLEI